MKHMHNKLVELYQLSDRQSVTADMEQFSYNRHQYVFDSKNRLSLMMRMRDIRSTFSIWPKVREKSRRFGITLP